MISLGTMVVFLATVTLVSTVAVVRAVSVRKPRNRRTHRLGAFLSFSPAFWRGPRVVMGTAKRRDPLLDAVVGSKRNRR